MMPKSNPQFHQLEYGAAEPLIRRITRHVPRPSVLTLGLMVLVAISHYWFWNDHQPWVTQKNFQGASTTLEGAVNPAQTRLLVGTNTESAGGIHAPFKIVDLSTQQIVCTFGKPNEWARNTAFSSDGTRLITIGGHIETVISGNSTTSSLYNDTVQLWDTATGAKLAQYGPLGTVRSSSGNPVQARFSPDSKRLVTLERDRAAMYDISTGQLVADLESRDGPGYFGLDDSVYFSPDGHLAVVETDQGPVRIRSTFDGHLIAERVLENGSPNGFAGAFSPDGKVFACADTGWLYAIDPTTGLDVMPAVHLRNHIESISFSPDNLRLFAVVLPGLTSIDMGSPKHPPATRPIPAGMAHWIVSNARTGHIAIHSYDGALQILDPASLKVLRKLPNQLDTREYPNSAAPDFLSPDQSRSASISQNGSRKVELRSTTAFDVTSTIDDEFKPSRNFTDVAFKGDSAHLLTDTDQGVVSTWTLRRPEAGWGVIALPQFWLMSISSCVLLFSVIRDGRRWRAGEFAAPPPRGVGTSATTGGG